MQSDLGLCSHFSEIILKSGEGVHSQSCLTMLYFTTAVTEVERKVGNANEKVEMLRLSDYQYLDCKLQFMS